MSRAWYALLLGWTCLLPRAYAQPGDAPPPGGQVLTGEELARAGVTRLTDLFDLLDGWYAHSVDAYTWSASAGGLAAPGTARWALFVDGLPVDLTMYDRTHLNLLPVHVSQLDSVVAVRMPAVSDGVLAAAGALHLYTRPPPRGAAVGGSIAAGNEVNDPGPFRYTASASPNIDRSGPLFLAQASARGGGAYLRATATFDEFHATDERILTRVRARYRGEHSPRLLLSAPGLHAGMTHGASRHRLLAGFATFYDLMFWEPFGAEIPATHRVLLAGVGGTLGAEPAQGLRYRASLTRYDLAPRPNRDTLDLDLRQDRLDLNLETRLAGAAVQGRLGAGLRYVLTETASPVRDPSFLTTRAYVHLTARPDPGWDAGLALFLSHTYDRIGVSALAHNVVRPAPGHQLWLRLALTRETVEEQNSLWYWIDNGYRAPAAEGAALRGLPYLPLASTVSADLGWEGRPTSALSFRVSGGVRQFYEQYVPVYRFAHDPATDGFTTDTRLENGVEGQVAGAGVGVRFAGPGRVDQRLHYEYSRPVWSSPAFWSAWSAQPWHQASYTVQYTPVPRFSLYASLRFRSGAAWPSFEPAAAATEGRVPARLPAFWLLDVTARKRFWGERLQASLSLRNLLDQPYRTHPAGVVTDLHLTFRVDVALGTGGPPP